MSFNFNRDRFRTSSAPVMRRDVLRASKVVDLASIAALGNETFTVDCPGASVGDSVLVTFPVAPTANLIFKGYVLAANVVTVRAENPTAGAINAASMTYDVTVIKAY